jgi:hypothetical protein
MREAGVREKWAKRIEQWKEGGLPLKEFASQAGINARSLEWWRWHLSKGDEAPQPRRRRRSRKAAALAMTKPPTLSTMKFIEMAAPTSRDDLEVVLPSTIRICVRPGFDVVTLGRLLDVLEQRR